MLQKAFELIYMNGYQATSIDEIIASTQVTKGAFFYHFKNKDEMGLAMINEILLPSVNEGFMQTLSHSADPVKSIYDLMKHLLLEHPFLKVSYGCPAGNLTQEMSPLNPAFAKALAKSVKQWDLVIEACIRQGKKTGTIRKTVNAQQVSLFVMSGYWGVRNFGKLYNSKDCYKTYLKELKAYLKTLC